MQRRLTITLDEQVYDGLQRVAGRGKVSQFIENVVRPHVLPPDLDAAYREMAEDTERETDAHEWVEALVGDCTDEAR